MDNRNRIALAAFLLIGTAAVLTFTTDRGARIRRDTAKGSKKLAKRLRRQAEAAGEDVGDFAQRLVGSLTHAADRSQDRDELSSVSELRERAEKKGRKWMRRFA